MSKTNNPTVALTHEISQWLQKSGATAGPLTGLPVDLADALAAADRIRSSLGQLLRLNPREASQAEEVLALAADIEAQISSELLPHVAALEAAWPGVVEALGEHVPDSEQRE